MLIIDRGGGLKPGSAQTGGGAGKTVLSRCGSRRSGRGEGSQMSLWDQPEQVGLSTTDTSEQDSQQESLLLDHEVEH